MLDKDKLISRLNWFYSLELNQVDLYKQQSKSFPDEYAGLVFEKLAEIEQTHVDNISAKIIELGASPTKIGDVLSPIVGSIAGKLIGMTDLDEVLKINILIEQKAMRDYKELINSLRRSLYSSDDLLKLLTQNFIDENLHTEWFKTKLSEIQTLEYSIKP